MRIKFLANGPIGTLGIKPHYRIYINPAYFMLKHYHTLHGNREYNHKWLLPDFIANRTAEEIVGTGRHSKNSLISDQVNLLLLPCFVWNMDLQMEVAKLYKERVPRGWVVVGGPQLTAHKDPKFFEKYPFIDYAVYGDGEKALSNIIDYLSTGTYKGRQVNLSQASRKPWVNTVENINGKAYVWPFSIMKDELYWSTSPYLTQKTYIRDSLKKLYAEGFTNKHIVFALEFARGCMYKCAYCDWSQNLTKKVTRRKAEWKLELEFFKKLDVTIRETDANFGQWDQDLEIYNYAKSLHDPKKNFKFVVSNISKKKKNSYHFLAGNGEYGGEVKFSFEDTEKEPLEAMSRPSLTWPEHQELIAKVKNKLGAKFGRIAMAELMLGSPKQSIATFKENFKKLLGEGLKLYLNHWVLLPNSPGADLNYQKKHGVKWKDHYIFQSHQSKNPGPPDSIDDLYKTAPTSPHFYKQTMVWKTNDMEYVDLLTTMIAGSLTQRTSTFLKKQIIEEHEKAINNHDSPNMSPIVEWLFDFSAGKAKTIFAKHEKAIEKYGYVVPFVVHKNKLYGDWCWHKFWGIPISLDELEYKI